MDSTNRSYPLTEGAGYDPGLTQQYSGSIRRIIERDGRFNVRRTGMNWRDANPYTYLISVSWAKFSVIVAIAFVLVNLLFALLYDLIGPNSIKGAMVNAVGSHFLALF